jgi:hypothetical protein
MKTKNIILIIISFLFLSAGTSNAQYKLNIGNFWVYSSEYLETRIAVIDTAIFFNSVLYYKLESISRSTSQSTIDINEFDDTCSGFYRKKVNGFYEHLVICTNPPDTTISEDRNYKYDAQLGERWIYRASDDGTPFDTVWAEVVDVFEGYQFGDWRTIKKITYWTGLTDHSKYFCDDFGELSEEHYTGISSWLKGCYIDGVAYGDTSFIVVSVSDESFPREFNLSQNYPNPFNPNTTIKFTVANVGTSRDLSLRVYDILGREIQTLLNKPMQPGNYEIAFDGSNLTSGVYFYVLETSGKRLSKKMLLVK